MRRSPSRLRRVGRRVAALLATVLAAVLAAGVAVVLLALYTAAGRDRVRDVVVRIASRHLAGSLHLGALRFAPPCAVSLDSLAMRGPDDSLLVATGPLHARCDGAALLRGRLVLRTLTVTRPVVAVRELPAGGWNWARALRRDTVPRTRVARTAAAIVVHDVRLRDGTVTVASRADSVPTRWSGLQLRATRLRAAAPDADVEVRVTRLEARGDRPPLAVRDARGTLRVARDSMWLSLARVVVGRSAGRAEGVVTWAGPSTRLDVRADADTVAFVDLAWLDARVPAEGGGRARLRLRTGARPGETEWTLRGVDVASGGSRLRGHLSATVDSEALAAADVALDLAPLRLDLVRRLVGRPLPYGVRGDVRGRVVARARRRGALDIDSVDLRLRDARFSGAESHVRLRGAVDVADRARPRFRRLRVESDGVDARSLVASFPALPRLAGRLAFAATLDSAADDLRLSDARLTYRDPGAPPLSLRAAGRVSTRGARAFVDGTVRLEPLPLAALARAVPSLRGAPELRGELAARGTLDDLALRATLASRAGSLSWDGRVDVVAPSFAASGRVSLRRLDLRELGTSAALPATDLSLDATVALRGTSPRDLAGSADVRLDSGLAAGVALLPSLARLRLEPGRVVVDSAALRTALGELHAGGAFGRAPSRRDTLNVTLRTDSLARLLALARPGGGSVSDTVAAGAATATATARVVGSVDTFEVRGTAEVTALAAAPLAAARGRAEFEVVGLPAAPSGRATLALDSARVASVSFRSLTADVAAPRAGEWRVAARSGADEEPGVAVSGTVTRADSGAAAGAVWSVALDSLDVRARGTGLRLAAPARVRAGPAGVFVDTLELTGRRGAHLRAAAALRADGPVDAFLSADEVPLAALALLAGRTDSATLARLPATLTAEARLGGTRAAPVASIEGALHGAPRPDSAAREAPLLDSVHVRGTYDEDRAAAALGIFAAGRRLLALEAEVPVRASLAPGSVAVLDTVLDAPLAGRLVVDSVALGDVRRSFPTLPGMAGTVRARVALSGTARHPRLDGELRVRDGALDAEALGVALDSVQVEVALLGDTLVLRRASVRGTGDAHGPGRATLGGWVALADPSDPTFDLRLRAARMPVVALDRRAELEVDADLRLAGARHGATLGGSATARRGVVRLPELGSHDVVGDADTAFVRLVDSLTNRKEDRGRRAAANGLLDRLTIRDLELRAGDDVWLRSSEANLSIGGAVRVTRVPPRGGDTARVEVSGELRAVRGTYALDVGPLRRTFTLESGVLRFDGADALDPRLDVSAVHVLPPDPSLARTREVRVRARLRGTLQHPELTLDDAAGVAGATGTALTQEELLGYLVTGQPSFRVGQGEASNALARSELTSRVTGEVERRLGGGGLFDVVTITPGAVGEDDAASLWEQTAEALRRSRVGVGKRIDDRTFLSVDAGGCALAGAAAQGSLAESLGLGLDYRARPDLTFSLRSEPPTSATLCGGSLPHGYIPAPRQWGLEAVKRWRF